MAPDELGRIELECRAFLIEDHGRRILLETGIGAFFEPALRARYGVLEDRHVLLDSLSALGLTDADIDLVVLSHLHFDHAGGLLAAYRANSAPALLFPRARFVVGRRAFERAQHPHPRDRASFIPGLCELLEQSGRLTLVEPEDASRILGPAFEFVETDGHTPGMLHTHVRGSRGSAIFAADLIPGRAWIHLPVTMGYDRYPELLVDEKKVMLDSVLERDGLLLFTHDADCSASAISVDERGRYAARDSASRLRAWDLDTSARPGAVSDKG